MILFWSKSSPMTLYKDETNIKGENAWRIFTFWEFLHYVVKIISEKKVQKRCLHLPMNLFQAVSQKKGFPTVVIVVGLRASSRVSAVGVRRSMNITIPTFFATLAIASTRIRKNKQINSLCVVSVAIFNIKCTARSA